MTTTAMRFVPISSPLHRAWAGTKLLGITGLSLTALAAPTWWVEAACAAVLVVGAVAARLPRGSFPRLPLWFVVALLVPVLVGALEGGAPYVDVAGVRIGTGGLLTLLRGTGLALVFLGAALLVTATTSTVELTAAMGVLLGPLRRVRFPVDEFVLLASLTVRCLPLLVGEVSATVDAWRLRLPPKERRRRRAVLLLLSTALTVALRRSRELAEAMHSRGGLVAPPRARRPRLGLADGMVGVLIAGVVATAALT